MQSYARTSASPQHLHAAAVARGLLFGLARRREEQRITRQVGPRSFLTAQQCHDLLEHAHAQMVADSEG